MTKVPMPQAQRYQSPLLPKIQVLERTEETASGGPSSYGRTDQRLKDVLGMGLTPQSTSLFRSLGASPLEHELLLQEASDPRTEDLFRIKGSFAEALQSSDPVKRFQIHSDNLTEIMSLAVGKNLDDQEKIYPLLMLYLQSWEPTNLDELDLFLKHIGNTSLVPKNRLTRLYNLTDTVLPLFDQQSDYSLIVLMQYMDQIDSLHDFLRSPNGNPKLETEIQTQYATQKTKISDKFADFIKNGIPFFTRSQRSVLPESSFKDIFRNDWEISEKTFSAIIPEIRLFSNNTLQILLHKVTEDKEFFDPRTSELSILLKAYSLFTKAKSKDLNDNPTERKQLIIEANSLIMYILSINNSEPFIGLMAAILATDIANHVRPPLPPNFFPRDIYSGSSITENLPQKKYCISVLQGMFKQDDPLNSSPVLISCLPMIMNQNINQMNSNQLSDFIYGLDRSIRLIAKIIPPLMGLIAHHIEEIKHQSDDNFLSILQTSIIDTLKKLQSITFLAKIRFADINEGSNDSTRFILDQISRNVKMLRDLVANTLRELSISEQQAEASNDPTIALMSIIDLLLGRDAQ